MTDIKDRFKILRDELALSSEERSYMRDALIAAAEAPMTAITVRPTPSPFSSLLFYARTAGVMALLLVLVGGTSTAAKGALPGEILYPVKVSLNERVERLTAFSKVSKANVEIRHAEERLREVQLLSAEGEVDTRDVEDIAREVGEHIARADEAAKALKDTGDAAAADRIETAIASALGAHADILEAQAEGQEDEERRRLRALSVAVSVTADDVLDTGTDLEDRDQEELSSLAAAREEEVRKRIEHLREELEENGIPAESEEELLAELAEIEAEFGDARALVADESYAEASEAYDDIAHRAYRTEALLTSARRINDKTGKDVYIRFDGRQEARMGKMEADTSESIMLMTVPVMEEAQESEGPELEFRVEESAD